LAGRLATLMNVPAVAASFVGSRLCRWLFACHGDDLTGFVDGVCFLRKFTYDVLSNTMRRECVNNNNNKEMRDAEQLRPSRYYTRLQDSGLC